MKALILAGRTKNQLDPVIDKCHLSLLPINNRELLFYQLDMLAPCEEVLISTNYNYNILERHLRSNGLDNVTIVKENENLGTAGAIRNIAPTIGDEFIVLNGDVVSDFDTTILRQLGRKRKQGIITSIFAPDVSKYGFLRLSEDKVSSFYEKMDEPREGWINAGIYYLTSEVFDFFPKEDRPISLELDVFPRMAQDGLLQAYKHKGFWSDLGTMEDYISANVKISGKSVVFGRNCMVKNSEINNSVIHDNCLIEDSRIVNSIICRNMDIISENIESRIVS